MFNFLYNLKNASLPSKANGFSPLLLRGKAISSYAILTMAILSLVYAPTILPTRLLAQLAQNAVVEETNSRRVVENLLPLEVNDKLALAAQMKAQDMIDRDYFSHDGPDGERPWTWLEKTNYDYAAAGENLAIDFFDVKALVKAWMNSPSHAKNIVNSYFTDFGIGIARGEFDGRETIAVVMFFGKEITPEIASALQEKEQEESDENSVEEKEIKPVLSLSENVPPADTALIQIVEDDILVEEKIIVAYQQASQADNSFVKTNTSSLAYFSFTAFPVFIKNLVIFFYLLLMAISIFAAVVYKENIKFLISRLGFLLLFLFVLL